MAAETEADTIAVSKHGTRRMHLSVELQFFMCLVWAGVSYTGDRVSEPAQIPTYPDTR